MNIPQPHRWTGRQICAVIALCLTAGMAVGQNVTIPWPTVSYKGSVELVGSIGYPNCEPLYTVPAGLKLRLTSILIDSMGSTVPLNNQYICSGTGIYCSALRTGTLTVPANGTLSVPLTSGILFNPGEIVRACNASQAGHSTSWSLYGFLYR